MILKEIEKLIKEDGFVYVAFSFCNVDVILRCSSMDLILDLFNKGTKFRLYCKDRIN